MSGPAREGPLGDGSASPDCVTPVGNGRSIRLSDRLALRPNEAAMALGVSERTLRKWRRDEGLPYFRLDGAVLIPRAELERWIAERVTSNKTADQIAEEVIREL